jgi:hypothetical protein
MLDEAYSLFLILIVLTQIIKLDFIYFSKLPFQIHGLSLKISGIEAVVSSPRLLESLG